MAESAVCMYVQLGRTHPYVHEGVRSCGLPASGGGSDTHGSGGSIYLLSPASGCGLLTELPA